MSAVSSIVGRPFSKGGDPRRGIRQITEVGLKRRIRSTVVPEISKALPGLVLAIRAGDPQAIMTGLQLAAFALQDEPDSLKPSD